MNKSQTIIHDCLDSMVNGYEPLCRNDVINKLNSIGSMGFFARKEKQVAKQLCSIATNYQLEQDVQLKLNHLMHSHTSQWEKITERVYSYVVNNKQSIYIVDLY